ncbi:hypothetical protein ABW365_01775 [Enterococcus avium]
MLFVIPATRDSILAASSAHPYIGGFVQFSILATMGISLESGLLLATIIFLLRFFYERLFGGSLAVW